jgi:ribosome-associated toxin RatA of RatAB toxin-antitoxin module
MAIVTGNRRQARPAGGRGSARLLPFVAALAAAVALAGGRSPAVAASDPEPAVQVHESQGIYSVAATFGVPRRASVVMSVLTDYEAIPRFMPDVRRSSVLERTEGRARVEQEAVAKFMMFSKRVHLILEVEELAGTIGFRDACGKSFALYHGAWTIAEQDGRTTVTYRLRAKPSFDVPEFLLKRLLKRDAGEMIEGLRREIATRPE